VAPSSTSWAQLALGGAGRGQVLAAAGPDLNLRGDQLPGDGRAQQRVLGAGVAQLLEAADELQALRIEDRELLLKADGEVGGCLKRGTRGVDVKLHGNQSGTDESGQIEVQRVEQIDCRA
jgi:hypothetical protein